MISVFIFFMFRAFLIKKVGKISLDWLLYFSLFFLYHLWLIIRLIKISCNVEENPGPKRNSA